MIKLHIDHIVLKDQPHIDTNQLKKQLEQELIRALSAPNTEHRTPNTSLPIVETHDPKEMAERLSLVVLEAIRGR